MKMINVQLKLNRSVDQTSPMMRIRNAIQDYGIKFVEKNGDILLVHQIELKKLRPELSKRNQPTILLEWVDSTIIDRRKEISFPHVIGILKNITFRDQSLTNEVHCDGRYHGRLIKETANRKFSNVICRKHPVIVPSKDFKKVEVGYSFGSYGQMKLYVERVVTDFDAPRISDLHFAGCTSYKRETITFHRRLAVIKAKQLKCVKVDVSGGRKYRKGEYMKMLKNTKIVLSPWGFGEACYRDYEAMYMGCILLKPDSSYVKCWPEIYLNNKTYVPCKPDFSDLQEKTNYIIQNWNELKDMRQRNANMLIEHYNTNVIAKHIAEVIKRCVSRI